jgi:aminoglycoside phosphotransferase (APT) family kinase protein
LAKRLERAVAPRADVLAACERPVFLHDDFQPGNVLALPDDDGGLRFTGLIDFGNARAGDPLMDLAKSIFCCAHEHPPSVEPLRQGYGRIDHPDPETALWLYLLLHRLTMWAYLKGFGAAPDALLRDLAEMAA